MARGAQVAGGAAAGAVAWSMAEYAVHRWVMHGRRTSNPVTAEHLDHHRDLQRTDPIRLDRSLMWPIGTGLAVGSAVSPLAGTRAGVATGASFAACYCAYRQLHWAIHHRAPRARWGAYLRRHHLRHHVGHPRANHGVTTPVWDLILQSYRRDDGPVAMPASLAPPWSWRPDGSADPAMARVVVLR